MNRSVALFQMNSAIFLFGLSAILATQMTVHTVMIVWGRSVFAILALTLIMVPGKTLPWKAATASQVGKLGVAGLVLCLHWITFFLGVYYGGVVLATLGFASFPAFVIILNSILERKPPAAPDLAVVALIIIGMIMVIPSLDFQNATLPGLAWGLAAGFLYAVIILGNRILTRGVPAMASCWWQ